VLELQDPGRHNEPQAGDQVDHLFPYGKSRESGDRKHRHDDAGNEGILRLRSYRVIENPRRKKQDAAEDEVANVTQLGIDPFDSSI
jgi:hypothetical protein